jgi:HEAT repeat protein
MKRFGLTALLVAAAICLAACNFQVKAAGPADEGAAPTTIAMQAADAPAQGSPEERIAAMGRMAMEKKPAHRDALRAGLADTLPLVRRHAIYGLQRLGDAESVPAIARLALEDNDFAVRRTAVIALGRLPHKESGPALVKASSDSNMFVRCDALLALGRLADPTTQPAMISALEERQLWIELEPWPQVAVIRAVGQPFFSDKNVIPVLRQLCQSRDWPRRSYAELTDEQRHQRSLLIANAAAEVLAVKFGDNFGEDLLIEGLSGDDYMQQRSALALAAIRSKKGVPALLKALEREWAVNKRLVINALAASGDASEAVTSRLAEIAKGDHPRLSRAALEALATLNHAHPLNEPAPFAVVPPAPEGELPTPGGKRPPQFIILGVDDCANIDGLEAMLDIVETLAEHGQRVNYTLWVAPLAGDARTRDLEKQILLIQRLFDTGSEIAHHTLRHNPGGRFWTSLPKEQQIEEIEGCTQWFRDNIVGFTRPFTYKGGGGASGTPVDMEFSRALLERQNFIYRGRRGDHPNNQQWPSTRGSQFTIDIGCLDGSAREGRIHANIVHRIHSDYPGQFDYEVEEGVAMFKANFDFRYNHPLRPILAVNAFHDWGFQFYGNPTHRNQAAIVKAFLMDVLVHNRDKYPDVHVVTFRQVVEYVVSGGDLEHTLAAGNCQDSRNPVKPKIE